MALTTTTWQPSMEKIPGSGRPKGTPKTGGRRKGTPNKRTLQLQEKLAGFADPAEFLAATMSETTTPVDVRIDCAKALLPYIYPRLQATEVTGRNGGPVELDHEFMSMIGDDPELFDRMEELHIQIAKRKLTQRSDSSVERIEAPDQDS